MRDPLQQVNPVTADGTKNEFSEVYHRRELFGGRYSGKLPNYRQAWPLTQRRGESVRIEEIGHRSVEGGNGPIQSLATLSNDSANILINRVPIVQESNESQKPALVASGC